MRADDLAENYSPHFRKLEIISIISFFTISTALAWRLRGLLHAHAPLGWTAWILGWIAADFISGFVHWMGDTWGTTEWFLVGQTLIRTFREHHVDPESITRHDFIDTNGTNCLISLPLMIFSLGLPATQSDLGRVFVIAFFFSMTLWVFATNQIHKWSHQKIRPNWVSALQRSRLILSPEHHSEHHHYPFSRQYCITTGWLNPMLTRSSFFQVCENLVTLITGARPREHDGEVTPQGQEASL
jgi:hypothetical protein